MKRKLSLTLLIVCIICLLSSCGNSAARGEKLLNEYYEANLFVAYSDEQKIINWDMLRKYTDQKSSECNDNIELINKYLSSIGQPEIEKISVGNIIEFGSYEVDGDATNGTEPLLWRVLEIDGDKVLLITYQCIDCVPYNQKLVESTWGTSYLRKWCNNDFLTSAFSEKEQSQIAKTKVINGNKYFPSEKDEENTEDYVFCLSIGEAETYLSSETQRTAEITTYAEMRGALVDGSWWLRTQGDNKKFAATVGASSGKIFTGGGPKSSELVCVRPALWISF